MIPTPTSVRKVQRKLDRERRQAEKALATMRDRGVTLQCLGRGGWRLSNGERISAIVARILTFDRNVAAVVDGLFGAEFPELSQTFRYVEET